MRGVKISVVPMLLYFLFILAAILYCYTRIRFGMGGLNRPLKSYSFFVLAVEMLGAINMLFYGCWLFAKPVNDDVFPEPNELVRCCVFRELTPTTTGFQPRLLGARAEGW